MVLFCRLQVYPPPPPPPHKKKVRKEDEKNEEPEVTFNMHASQSIRWLAANPLSAVYLLPHHEELRGIMLVVALELAREVRDAALQFHGHHRAVPRVQTCVCGDKSSRSITVVQQI